MTLIDIILMTAILSGASYLLYRSGWKNRGKCHGCSGKSCQKRL